MARNHKASLQVLLALAARLQLDRRTKFLALALFTDRCIPLLDNERPVTLPLLGESLCTLVCLNRAAQWQSKDISGICMADIQAAAAEELGPSVSSIDVLRVERWLEPRLSTEGLPQLSSDGVEDMLTHLQRTGMPAFAASTADNGLLLLCDSLLEALHFCPGFHACLTRGGTLLAAAVIGAAVLLHGGKKDAGGCPGVVPLLADIAGHPKDVIRAHIMLVLSAVLQQ